MHDTNIITKTRLNQSQKRDKNSCNQCQSIGLIPTPRLIRRVDKDVTEFRQLSLFSPPSTPDDDLSYALQIKADRTRSHPHSFCIIYDPISQIELPGVYSYAEADCILNVTRGFNLYPESFKKLLLAIRDRALTNALLILESELGLKNEQALLFLRQLTSCGCSLAISIPGGEADA